MEKVEKLLLLVVLGAAMVIMAVMSFGSEDPSKPGNTNPDGRIPQARLATEGNREGLADPRKDPARGQIAQADPGQQTIDDLGVPKVVDGPKLGKVVGQGSELDPHAKGKDAAANEKAADNPKSTSKGDFPGGPESGTDSRVSPMAPPSSGVITADVHLEPGDEPGIWIYTVQPKDSLSGIMEKITGSTRNVAEIIAGWNEGMDQNVIRPGQKIQIPESMILSSAKAANPAETTRRTAPENGRMPVPGMIPAPIASTVDADSSRSRVQASPASTRTPVTPRTESYRIQKGETLWAIARRRVGERRANAFVREVQQLNPGLEPSELRPKDVIQLPAR